MDRVPQVRIIFVLTKKNSDDFDYNAVTERLGIIPTEVSGPMLSKGKISCDRGMKGITVLPSQEAPYPFVKHAFWSIELPKTDSWSLDDPLHQMEGILAGKEMEIQRICKDYNLEAELVIRIFALSNSMPEIQIASDSISFWNNVGTSINFDFYLD